MSTSIKSTERFSNTVEYYIKYRPHYPQQIIALLIKHCLLGPSKIIADIGSGTGILTKLLLDNNFQVRGVEPNQAMRIAAEQILQNYKNFTSLDGTAEQTTLVSHSIDLITVAQAFHWFDPIKVKQEFLRILKPDGWCVLLWNLRDSLASPFMHAYEELLLKHGTDYKQVAAENVKDEKIRKFFNPLPMNIEIVENIQILDWEGVKGRILSTSYLPKTEDQAYTILMQNAKQIFEHYQQEGKVNFIYQCKCYYGQLSV
ncbi:MAG: hypothetical protein A3E87_06850 [Gammaproteobacteria bacterium RIFCSPHIGHO2_12_FULL_35_23]|nr:MAG: hypothetical protein A3E87_06850 [Gammaproteobacteria bacterium RIFCSPHIGHO2_12_FULL_35_23]